MYYPLSSPQLTHTIDYSDNSSSITYILNNLDGYTNYSCSISACTSSGCSSFSQSIVFLTDENGIDQRFICFLIKIFLFSSFETN